MKTSYIQNNKIRYIDYSYRLIMLTENGTCAI
jgi:hypothetical protein